MANLFETASLALERGEELALATVVRVSGSSPRHTGAKMLVWQDGSISGTIGGGRIEVETIEHGRRVASGAPALRFQRHLVRDLAMCCGGTMDIYVEPLGQSRTTLQAAVSAIAARKPVVLCTSLRGGSKQLEEANPASRTELDDQYFRELILPAKRLFLFGAGHVSQQVGPLAASVGFDVVLCDDGETAPFFQPAWAKEVVDSFDVADVERQFGPLGSADSVVIMTRDHSIDQRVLEQLIQLEHLGYLGLIGSRRKVGRFRMRLEAKGLYTDARWSRLHAPVGLDIGAETPQEIAVSIVAELIQVRSMPQAL